MDVFIALYRGINVGGKNPVKMESLRAMHERLGHKEVKSYIQSGNIVFSANGLAEANAQKMAAGFAKEFGFAAKVVVVDAKRWGTIVEGNPYAKFATENPKTVHAGICEGEPSAKGLKALLAKTGGSETFVIGKGTGLLKTDVLARNSWMTEMFRRIHGFTETVAWKGNFAEIQTSLH